MSPRAATGHRVKRNRAESVYRHMQLRTRSQIAADRSGYYHWVEIAKCWQGRRLQQRGSSSENDTNVLALRLHLAE